MQNGEVKHTTDIIDKIRIDGNHDARVLRIIDTGPADTSYLVQHQLGRVPVCFRLLMSNKSCNAYVVSKDQQNMTVKFSTANCDVNVEIY